MLKNRYRKLSKEEFIKMSIIVHELTYDYSKFNYKNFHEKGIIICYKHGEFQQTPHNHIKRKSKCPKCAQEGRRNKTRIKSLNLNLFIERAKNNFGNMFNYDKFQFKNMKTKGIIICNVHNHEFLQSPDHHLRTFGGCPKCIEENNHKNENDFIKNCMTVFKDKKFNYSKTIYKGHNKKVCITCELHGDFYRTPDEIRIGYNCKKCDTNISKGNRAVRNFLLNHNIKFESEYRFEDCRFKRALPFDFAIFDNKNNLICLIEYDGPQHFRPCNIKGKIPNIEIQRKNFKEIQRNDKIKNEYCKSNNITLIRLSYLDYKNLKINLALNLGLLLDMFFDYSL